MWDTIAKKTEFAANISIILVALMVGLLLIRRNFFDRPAQPEFQSGPAVGTAIPLPELDWTTHEKNVLLILSTTCRFCSASAPFYQRLANEVAQRKDARLIALLPQTVADGRTYLDGLQVPVTTVLQASVDRLGAKGFPTVILADRRGVVTKAWSGQLPLEQEMEILQRLR